MPKKNPVGTQQTVTEVQSPEPTFTMYFNPRANITAFELAAILLTLPLVPGYPPIGIAGITATAAEWKRLPPPLRTFFEKNNPLHQVKPAGPWDAPSVAPPPVQQPYFPQVAEQIDDPFVDTTPQPVQGRPPIGPGPGPGIPSSQPNRPQPSFYHHEGVESLYPEGMSVAPVAE